MNGETILRGVLDRWKATVDAHEPKQAAGYFTGLDARAQEAFCVLLPPL